MVRTCAANYGQLIVDECHHLSGAKFRAGGATGEGRFVTGLATVTRKDGHHPIIFMQCGPVRHRVDARRRPRSGRSRTVCWSVPRDFNDEAAGSGRASRIPGALSGADRRRCRKHLICDDVVSGVGEGRSPLVLTERNEHLDRPAKALDRTLIT